jgi:hypothetical protein
VDLNHRPLGYELVGKLQIQLLCGADDNPRSRMNTVRHEHGDPCLTWVTKLKENLEPFARGLYVNQTSDRRPELAKSAYGSNYARLVEIKRKYDPDNVLG